MNDLLISPTEAAWANRQGVLLFAVAEAITQTFKEPFDFWVFHQGWNLSPYVGCSEKDSADLASHPFSSEECAHLSDQVRAGKIPLTHQNNNQTLLGIPVLECGEVVAVATRCYITDSPKVLELLAASFLKRWAEREELLRLQDENYALAEQVTQDLEELMFLQAVSSDNSVSQASRGMEQIADHMLTLLNDSITAKSLVLFLQGEEKGSREMFAWKGQTAPDKSVCESLLADHVESSNQQPVVRNQVHQTEEGKQRYPGVREFLLVPVATDSRTLGWLLAINRRHNHDTQTAYWSLNQYEFGTQEANLMATAASIMASQLANVELIQEKEDLLVKVVRSLVSAVEAKDQYTRGHSERVALYAQCLALHIGYTEEEADRLYLTGLLHDVGKIGVSDATLKKPGRLTDEEFQEIQRHPDEGWAILQGLQPLSYVLPGLLQHHERVDGKGYPDGLLGEQISQDGRILAVADAYDAMTSDRPYRKGMPTEKAESIIADGAGTQWDQEAVNAFFEVRDQINRIRLSYTPKQRPQRTGSLPLQGCRISQVTDDSGQLVTWS